MGAVSYIPKTGWNDFHKYHYVEEAALVKTIRPLLSAAGIMIIPNVISEVWERGVVAERNSDSSLCRVMVEYTVTDGSDSFRFRIPGYGTDKSDKSVYKAMTGSMKYALMKLFEVETGDDPERESGEPQGEISVTIEASDQKAEKGGRSRLATPFQLQRIMATMREKGMDRDALLAQIEATFSEVLGVPDDDDVAAQTVILDFLKNLTSEDAGHLIGDIEAWEPLGADA